MVNNTEATDLFSPILFTDTVITGFNTDIEYQGVTYHVQTEDKGVKTPLILSLVYNRGTILKMLLASGVQHEFRTTIHPGLHTPPDILTLAARLSAMGVKRYALQQFRAIGCATADLQRPTPADYPGAQVLAQVSALFPEFTLRDS